MSMATARYIVELEAPRTPPGNRGYFYIYAAAMLAPCRWNLYSLRCILALDMEATNMPLAGPIPEGRSFLCPHCGALYAVTHSRLSKSDSNIAKCVVCGKIMDQWESTDVRIFKLVHRPEDA
jgi:predicted RNA-binding Zn-ribbon protein involved in translation (DUF1610 family)